MPADNATVRIVDLRKSFGDHVVLDGIDQLADHVAVLDHGRIVAESSPTSSSDSTTMLRRNLKHMIRYPPSPSW
jgi:ABC-type Na+ transport system ATPase subunit NatA